MLIVWGVLITLAVGLAAKLGVDAYNRSQGPAPSSTAFSPSYIRSRALPSITWVEFVVAAVVCAALIVPAVVWAGGKVAVGNLVSYNENWGGFETAAPDPQVIRCTRDGSCRYEYDCDPWTEVINHPAQTDSKGNVTRPAWTETRTHWHQCPYTTHEYTYTVKTTLGDYTIASHWLPASPDEHRWRRGKNVPDRFPSGVPADWKAARERIAAGRPGPVVKRAKYDNYILASQQGLLKRYSEQIDTFKKAGALPKLTAKIAAPYHQRKVYPVGVRLPGGEQAWQSAGMRLAAALGTDLQGDLHTVVVSTRVANDPAAYLGALMAYWQGPEMGKDALSKNGIVLVIGTEDGRTVKWARAATGMPVGNDELAGDLQRSLEGQPLDPRKLLGAPTAKTTAGKTQIVHTGGAVENVLWGAHKFERVSMSCADEGENCVGYEYLKSQIEPTGGQKAVILLLAALASLLAWGACLAVGDHLTHRLIGWVRN